MSQSKQAQHYPGPWSVSKPWSSGDVLHVEADSIAIPGKARTIAEIRPNPWDNGTATIEANARLIAAAPELLAALRAILPPDGEPGTGEWWGLSESEQRERIYTAIAKAEGRGA